MFTTVGTGENHISIIVDPENVFSSTQHPFFMLKQKNKTLLRASGYFHNIKKNLGIKSIINIKIHAETWEFRNKTKMSIFSYFIQHCSEVPAIQIRHEIKVNV